MKTNPAARALIKKYEGLRLSAYQDAVGLATIGYGHLIKKGEHFDRLTPDQAEDLFSRDLELKERDVERLVLVGLNENQHGALVSWVFNLGGSALRNSTLLKRINASEFQRAPGEMMRWVLASGRPLRGLIRRRAAEAELFIT